MSKKDYIDVIYNFLNNLRGYITYHEVLYLVNGVLNNDTENNIQPTKTDVIELSKLLERGDCEEEFYKRLGEVINKHIEILCKI